MRDPELSQRTTDLLNAVDLTDDGDRNIGKFSRGMLQRTGIAQALINLPELLILDEPTSALDPLSRLRVREILLRFRSERKSVFLSSHQLSEVELICDRVFFVQQGRVIASGKTHELLQASGEYEIVATGLANAPPYAHAIQTQGDRWTFSVPASQQRTTVEQIWSAAGTLVSVTPKTRTLEELFVSLLGAEDKTAK